MANEKDRLGNVFTNPDPRGGPAPAGTWVTGQTANGTKQGQIQDGVFVPVKTDKNG